MGAANKRPTGRYEPKKVHSTVNEVTSEDEAVLTINPNGELLKSDTIDVKVGGIVVNNMLIDSGATCNVINESVWKSLKRKGVKCKTEPTNKKLYSYAADKPLKILGKFQAKAQIGSNQAEAEFYVIKGNNSRPLLGCYSAQKLGC